MNSTLKPWHEIATPHEDIRAGRLEEAIFAANLWAVVQGSARDVYGIPEHFFRKSYMTAGLASILKRVARGLAGHNDAGDRIFSLQTSFGGGKTHTEVALYHLAKYTERLRTAPEAGALRQTLGEDFPQKVNAVAVFTNQSCDATQGRQTPEGVHTRTLWGELALQLGNGSTHLYDKIRVNDETQRVPQGLFVEILREAAPCLILLDELADYCVGAAAVPVGDSTLADQTISFIQQLEEAVAQVPGAVVVATLPASSLEVGQSEKSQELFSALEKRFARMGADVKPVSDNEIYAVVRARLFESIAPGNEADYPNQVAEAYAAMYAAHSTEVPTEAARPGYREQIVRAYPFHPLLIDTLYTRWGSHPDFQRTRGVLRLLASIVGDLWDRRKTTTETQHLIQPCHVRWSIDAMQAALTRLWGPAFQSVVAADIIGEKANACIFDEERGQDYRREGIGSGLVAAILLGSFGGQSVQSGFSPKDVKLACSRHGVNWGYLDGALLELAERCFYLHDTAASGQSKRYWFGTKPRLIKLVVQYRQQNNELPFDDEILAALAPFHQKAWGNEATWRILVNPESDLPEQKSLSLLVLPPNLQWSDREKDREAVRQRVMQLSQSCGSKERLYRNTLLFLVPSARGLTKLRQAHRERATLLSVKADYESQLDDPQKVELQQKLEAAEKNAREALGPAYTVILRINGQSVEDCVLADARISFPDHMSYLWKTLVEEEEWILRRVGSVTLQKTGLILTEGALRVKDAVDAFLRFTDKPIVATKEAVTLGLSQACKDGQVGIGRGSSLSTLQTRYIRQSVSLDVSEEGVWIIPAFQPDTAKSEAALADDGFALVSPGGRATVGAAYAETVRESVENEVGGMRTAGDRSSTSSETVAANPSVKQIIISGTVPMESWSDIFRSFISPGTRMNLKNLRLGIRFELEPSDESPIDTDDATLKTMKEASRQLGLKLEIN